NLLDNALRYGLASEEAKRITVALVDNPQSVVLSVYDNGPGVTKAQLQKNLSKRWVQGAAGEALKEGSGLGLAIVKAYVSLMGAKLQLDNETPHGLRVSVTFSKPFPKP
ncbi:MAG: ATP-binding protein, partial [Burkholderiales bacterium]|nr:ATP-binding protein [Burkholderiales bacterium]